MLFDNSAFELGAGIFDEFGRHVVDLKPTWYVIPDVRHNGPETIESYKKFVEIFPDLPGIGICAIQGETFDDLVDCYKFMIEKTEKIAAEEKAELEELGATIEFFPYTKEQSSTRCFP